jgi:hypothetical protein
MLIAIHINISVCIHGLLPLQLAVVWNDNYLVLFHQTLVQSAQHTLACIATRMDNLLASHHTYKNLDIQ